MVKPLSLDLRERIVAAVASGMSRRQAAKRFGVSPASAVRYCALDAKQGDACPRPQGGDRRSHKIEAHAGFILDAVSRKPDITLVELSALLAERDVSVAVSTLWRFFDRRRITFKKRLRTPASRAVQMS
jgi:transposase